MDAKAAMRYGPVPMRLLLFLSAVFAALAGVTSTRAEAQAVQASALAVAPLVAAAVAAPVAHRFVAPAIGRIPPTQPALPRLVGAVAGRLLYAERRRE